jgi:CRP-like cAMP-binding protein
MDAARLRSIPLFQELSDGERQRVARWADQVDVPSGQALVSEGAFAHEFFVIEEGTAEVRKGDQRIAELGEGDFFGEIALLEQDRRTASVVATTPMKAIVMFGRDFREMEREMPEVARRVRTALEERRNR